MIRCDCCATWVDYPGDVLCGFCLEHCVDDEDLLPFNLDEEVSAQ